MTVLLERGQRLFERPLTLAKRLVVAKNQIIVVALFFAAGMLGGLWYPDKAEGLSSAFGTVAAELMEFAGPLGMTVVLFVHNSLAIGITMLFGIFFGVVPLGAALVNGLLAGHILFVAPELSWLLLPHGIFELPAVFTGWGLGVWCGMWIFQPGRSSILKSRVGYSLRVYFMLILPLLALAAMIEGGLILLLT